jgi:hypothetical protein
MSLKALADAVLERDVRAGQGRDARVEKCSTDESCGGPVVPAGEASGLRTSAVIEATLRTAMPWPELITAVKPHDLEFPLCPTCRQRRYWLGRRGKIVCSQCGEVRFLLTNLEFHVVQ